MVGWILLAIVLGVLLAGWAIRVGRSALARRRFKELVGPWPTDDDLGLIVAGLPTSHWPASARQERFVLVLGGLNNAPVDVGPVADALGEADIPFESLRFFDNLTSELAAFYNDRRYWYRQVMSAYDRAAKMAEHVDVIGFSQGGVLAAWLAGRAKVRRLILCAPNFACAPEDRKLKRLLCGKWSGPLVKWLWPAAYAPVRAGRPNFVDANDPAVFQAGPKIGIFPLATVVEAWHCQSELDLAKVSAQEIFLLQGADDRTVHNDLALQMMQQAELEFEHHVLDNTAHNLFFDYQKDQAIGWVLEKLNARDADLVTSPTV